MKYIPKRYKSFILQMLLVQIQATYSSPISQRAFIQNYGRNANYSYGDSRQRDFYYMPQTYQMQDKPVIFFRKIKSGNPGRMLNIDLSGLRQDKDLPMIHSKPRHKSPMGMMGIDVSALSRNPDPSLPIAMVHPKNIYKGKSIMSYDFDPKYDRLPVIKTKPIRTFVPPSEGFVPPYGRPAPILPGMHVPLKVITTYHSVLTNKKEDIDFDFNGGSSNDIESEQKYTANFILHLLYQLSSNYPKMNDN